MHVAAHKIAREIPKGSKKQRELITRVVSTRANAEAALRSLLVSVTKALMATLE